MKMESPYIPMSGVNKIYRSKELLLKPMYEICSQVISCTRPRLVFSDLDLIRDITTQGWQKILDQDTTTGPDGEICDHPPEAIDRLIQ